MKEKLFRFLGKKYLMIAFAIFFTFFITRYIYYVIPVNQIIKIQKFYNEDIYDLTFLPNGIVSSKIGVTSTYDSLLISIPPEMRFHEFEVSIVNPETRVIYLIIVPLYAINGFKLGEPVYNGNENQYRESEPQYKQPKFHKITPLLSLKPHEKTLGII